ncbi:hypothetical protein AJ87_40420 [Rhizobium yanglingense]|nr:hypothetical protein AJ87_40420 [Rhizobium yanglingense]
MVRGIGLADLPDGSKLVGHCGDAQVLLMRRGPQIFAVDAHCTHYTVPSSTVWSPATPFAALGITHVST